VRYTDVSTASTDGLWRQEWTNCPSSLAERSLTARSKLKFSRRRKATHCRILGVFSVRDALPREIGAAQSLAEFNEQVNDARG